VAFAAVGTALLINGAAIGAVKKYDLMGFGGAYSHRDNKKPEVVEQELKSNCYGDAMLAQSARIALCFGPWHDDTDACIDDAQTSLVMDVSSCQIRNDKGIAAVAMLEPRSTDKVKAIDPEPLLEMLKEQPKPPPPQVVPPPQPQQPAPPPPAAKPRPMQVVENAKPETEQSPINARFLAEFDTRVEHQTVARGTPKEPMVAKSKPAELEAKDKPREASVKRLDEDRPKGADARAPDVPGTLSMRSPGPPSPAQLQQEQKILGAASGTNGQLSSDGYTPRKGNGALEQERHDRSEVPRGQGGAGGGTPDVPNLKPSQDVLERALGGGNVDHMEEVDNGDETALNAKRWVYASFFNRLKRQVAQNWDPAAVWRRSDPTGQVYGYKTRVTEVRVSLTARGDLAKIVVTAPSGVGELDDEAVRAFHAAAPFPNPPKELAGGSDGMITFAFSFYFEIGAPHTSWRVIRSM
jgi:TonB family protein